MASPRWATVQLPKGGEWFLTAAQVDEGGPSAISTKIQRMVHPMAEPGIPGTAAKVTDGRFAPDGLGTYTLLCNGEDCEKVSYTISTFQNPPDELRHVSDQIGDGVIPALVVLLLGFGALRKVKVYEVFVSGARDGFSTAVKIIPYLVAILFAVGMLRAAGGMSLLGSVMGPILHPLGVPAEILPMALLRPPLGKRRLRSDDRAHPDPRSRQPNRVLSQHPTGLHRDHFLRAGGLFRRCERDQDPPCSNGRFERGLCRFHWRHIGLPSAPGLS